MWGRLDSRFNSDGAILSGPLSGLIARPRGRGVGRLLLDAVLVFFRSRGVPRVVLSTAERNEAGQRLFASAGFRRTMIEMTREVDGFNTSEEPRRSQS